MAQTAIVARHQVEPLDGFRGELLSREEELGSILPPHISREKFVNTAIIAVKNNPELLTCDRRTLHAAVTKAAEDGLQPDGREGVITYFKVDGKKQAQWNPMLFGIRKRARELCDMIVDAQVVYENDTFTWHHGDDPRIEHQPAPLGADRGRPVGAYAVFKQGGTVLHREVMDVKQIEAVKSVSRAQNGAMWTKFWTEAWRKTVIRRGIKTVPSVPQLERLITRDDEHTEFASRGNVIPIGRDPVVIHDLDDNGPAPDCVSDEQADILRDLITTTGTNLEQFLAYAKAPSVSDVLAKDYPRLKAMLETKKAQQAKKGD